MDLLFELLPDLPRDSLRLVSHTLKNLSDEVGHEALDRLASILPILSAEGRLEAGADKLDVSRALQSSLNRLPLSMIHKTLLSLESGEIGVGLGRLVAQHSVFQKLIEMPVETARNKAFLSSEHLEIFGFEDLPVALSSIWDLEYESTRSLCVLSHLEEHWNANRLQELSLSQRSIRFELSAVQHLHENGFLPAVRAALAFGGKPEALHELEVFRNDTALRVLAETLLRMRLRVLNHVKGLSPLHTLSEWADYLRGPCSELAESRGITQKEAMSFAHFAFHLMNLCDLIEQLGAETHEAIRRSVSDVEDSIKEFASMRTAEGAQGGMPLERGIDPWGARLDLHRLADRLARLNGYWSKGGSSRGLVGMGRLDLDVCATYLSALQRLDPKDLERVGQTLRYAEFKSDFTGWDPDSMVDFMVSLGRALPEFSAPIKLDCSEVSSALETCTALGQIFSFSKNPIRIARDGESFRVSLELGLELKALLDLASHSADSEIIKMARDRILELSGSLASDVVHIGDSSVLPIDRDVEVPEPGMDFQHRVS